MTVTVTGAYPEVFITVNGPARILSAAAAAFYDDPRDAEAQVELRTFAHRSLTGGALSKAALNLGCAIRDLDLLDSDPYKLDRLGGEPLDDEWIADRRRQFERDAEEALWVLQYGRPDIPASGRAASSQGHAGPATVTPVVTIHHARTSRRRPVTTGGN